MIGGPAGCTLASSLASSAKKPTVLLLEAGGQNEKRNLRVDGKRWKTFMEENLNWESQTTPQEFCNGRQLDYSRGKGLGGGSSINFGVYTVGAQADYDLWAAEVDDENFSWNKMQARFKKLESFVGTIDLPEKQKYGQPDPTNHGYNGCLRVGYAKEWDPDLAMVLDAFEEAGVQRNFDHNSGNPLGFGLCINSASEGIRSTAADFLSEASDNLLIISDSPVQRMILDKNKVVAVEANGKKCGFCRRIIILDSGRTHETLQIPPRKRSSSLQDHLKPQRS